MHLPLPVRPLLTIAAGLLFSLGACAGSGDGVSGPPQATIGTGATEFQALADGDTAYVVQGPQGGFHIWGSVQVAGLDPGNADDLSDPSNPTTEFHVYVGSQRVDLGAAHYVQGLDPVGDGSFQMVGRAVILDITSDTQLDGMEIRFTVDVTAADGTHASDERMLVAHPDPNNL